MPFQININDLIQQAFQIRGYKPKFDEEPTVIEYPNVPTIDLSGDEPFVTSVLGTPIYEIITWKAGGAIADFEMLDVPLVDITRPKNIIKTPVSGRNGTVKELISHSDFQVRIRGILVNYDNYQIPPYTQIQALHQLCELQRSIPVESKLLNLLGIYNLVINSYNFPRLEGQPSTFPYVLNCLSDEPFELEYREEYRLLST